LRVVEIGRHRDHRPVDFGIDVALLGEKRLGPSLQLAKDERRNFGRREFPLPQANADDAPRPGRKAEWEQRHFLPHIVQPPAHEALDRVHGAARVGE
jgi:hypothetical protein